VTPWRRRLLWAWALLALIGGALAVAGAWLARA